MVFICSDKGLSSINGETWVTYKKNDNNRDGKAIITNCRETTHVNEIAREIPMNPSIAHNFIIGVDAER